MARALSTSHLSPWSCRDLQNKSWMVCKQLIAHTHTHTGSGHAKFVVDNSGMDNDIHEYLLSSGIQCVYVCVCVCVARAVEYSQVTAVAMSLPINNNNFGVTLQAQQQQQQATQTASNNNKGFYINTNSCCCYTGRCGGHS